MKNSIIHIFTANRYHLVPNITRIFITKIPDNHYFILIGDNNTKWNIYKKLFEEMNFKHYLFCTSFRSFVNNNNSTKNSCIILHGVPYLWMVYIYVKNYTNVHWVCWGSGAKIKPTIKSRASAFFKMRVFNSFKSIITLMDSDKNTLKTDFGIKNIETIPYVGRINDIYDFKRDNLFPIRSKEVRTVYLGNNSSCIKSYINILDVIKKYKGHINIQCMLNYSLVKNETYYLLKKKGKEYFGDNFRVNTEFYDLKNYPDYMNLCDIYICSIDNQSGLGAIYTLLKLGKKIYLSGHNYDWVISLGCKVHHVNEIINLPTNLFLSPLTVEEKLHNYDKIMKFTSSERQIKGWKNFFLKYNNLT